jgi:hypothetical protein
MFVFAKSVRLADLLIAHGDVAHGDNRIGQHLLFMPNWL